MGEIVLLEGIARLYQSSEPQNMTGPGMEVSLFLFFALPAGPGDMSAMFDFAFGFIFFCADIGAIEGLNVCNQFFSGTKPPVSKTFTARRMIKSGALPAINSFQFSLYNGDSGSEDILTGTPLARKPARMAIPKSN